MKLFAPKYYRNFKCIADKCKHSCCVGWEIDIDKNTLDKYNSLSHPYGEIINKSINFTNYPHFNLDTNSKCQHLNEMGLCNIILNCGDSYICDICREHPRFYMYTNNGKEVGIGMSCEAACELILNSNDFDEFVEITDVEGNADICEYDAIADRDKVFKILKNEPLLIDGKLEMIYDHFDICLQNYSFSDIIPQLEYLYEEHKALISKVQALYWNKDISDKLARILAYYVYRHCSESCDYDDFVVGLSYAIFCTGLISSLSDNNTVDDIARIISEEIEYSEDNTDMIKSLFY